MVFIAINQYFNQAESDSLIINLAPELENNGKIISFNPKEFELSKKLFLIQR